MDSRGRVQLHEACVVPFRLTSAGVQFCLVSPAADNRWEFPKTSVNGDSPTASLLGELAAVIGLRGHVRDEQPLGSFESSRGNESRSMTGYLMQVLEVIDTWPSGYRRIWCLPEEARVRIRRKPLRRFIDLALRCDGVRVRPASSGNAVGSESNGQHV